MLFSLCHLYLEEKKSMKPAWILPSSLCPASHSPSRERFFLLLSVKGDIGSCCFFRSSTCFPLFLFPISWTLPVIQAEEQVCAFKRKKDEKSVMRENSCFHCKICKECGWGKKPVAQLTVSQTQQSRNTEISISKIQIYISHTSAKTKPYWHIFASHT